MSHDWERRWEMALWIDLARIQWKQCHDSTNSSRFYVVPWNYITGTSANTLKTSCWLESQHFQKLVEVRFWKICLVNQRTFQTMLWVTLSRKWANSKKKKNFPKPTWKILCVIWNSKSGDNFYIVCKLHYAQNIWWCNMVLTPSRIIISIAGNKSKATY